MATTPIGGMSTESGPVLVTPGGVVVGSGYVPGPLGRRGGRNKNKQSGSSFSRDAQRAAEEAARQKQLAIQRAAEEAARQLEQRRKLASFLRASKLNQVRRITGQTIRSARALEEKLSLDVIQKLRTKEARGLATNQDKLKLSGAYFAQSLLASGIGITEIPKVLTEVAKNPGIVKKLPKAISDQGLQFGQLARQSPAAATGRVAAELVSLKGISRAIRATEELGVVARAGRKVRPGQTVRVATSRGGQAELKLVNKLPGEAIGTQVKRAGGTSRIATSAQANIKPSRTYGDFNSVSKLVRLLNSERILRKPLGLTKDGKKIEDVLSKTGKKRLKDFDSGKITARDLAILDREIRSKGSKGLLERSFFADPSGRVRLKRLGIQKQKPLNLYESISEDITFKKSKPQVLVFTDAQIEKFPKSLERVRNKLLRGKTLTQAESARLIQFQSRKSGKFKPLGFVSKESEITLAPGEIIKKQKVVGNINVKGRRVPIVRVEVYKPKGSTKELIKKLRNRKINSKELASLEKRLKKETGLNYNLSSRPKKGGRYVSLKKSGVTALTKSLSKYKSSSKLSRGKGGSRTSTSRSSRSKSSKTSRSGKSRSGKSSSSTIRTSTSTASKPRGGPKSSPRGVPTNFVKLSRQFKPIKLSRSVETYYVVEKVRGKFRKLYPLPLTAMDARDFAVYSIDNKLSKTAFFIPLGKNNKVVIPPKSIQGYYSQNSRKVRPYRIRFGRRKQLVNGYIEKRPYFRDTPGENMALKRLQNKASGKSLKRRTTKRKLTNSQKRELLKRLAKARRVRMRNLKKRK